MDEREEIGIIGYEQCHDVNGCISFLRKPVSLVVEPPNIKYCVTY